MLEIAVITGPDGQSSTEAVLIVSTGESHESTSSGGVCIITPPAEPVVAATSTHETESMDCGTDNPSTDSLSSELSRKAILRQFCDEWLESLDRDDLKSLSSFLCHQFVSLFQFTETKAAHYAANMVDRSDRTVCQWSHDRVSNDGVFPES